MFRIHSYKIIFLVAIVIALLMVPIHSMNAEESVDETEQVESREPLETQVDMEAVEVQEEAEELEESTGEPEQQELTDSELADDEQKIEENKEISSSIVQFEDAKLEALIAQELGIDAPLTEDDLLKLDTLSLYGDKSETKIKSLEGIQYAKKLTQIGLENQEIQDLSPLSNLTELIAIVFNGNKIDDLSPLANLKNVGLLYLEDNNISNLTPLIEMNSNDGLWQINLTNNNITDISPLQQVSFSDKNKRIRMLGNSVDDDRTIQHLIADGIYILWYEKHGISYEFNSERGLCELNKETSECKEGHSRIDMLHLVNTFPADQGFVVDQAGKVSVFNHSEVKLSADRLGHLVEHNLPLSIVNEKVQLIIPSSIFNNQDEEVTITLKELDRVDKSKSSVYDFSIQQGNSSISQFDEGITLTFDVEAGASDPNQLKIHVLNEKTNEWELIGGTYSEGKVSAVTTHFSTFAVFDVTTEDEQSNNDQAGKDDEPDSETPVSNEDEQKPEENQTDRDTEDTNESVTEVNTNPSDDTKVETIESVEGNESMKDAIDPTNEEKKLEPTKSDLVLNTDSTDQKNTPEVKEQNKESLPQTGEAYPVWMTVLGITALLGALGLSVGRKKRKEAKK